MGSRRPLSPFQGALKASQDHGVGIGEAIDWVLREQGYKAQDNVLPVIGCGSAANTPCNEHTHKGPSTGIIH